MCVCGREWLRLHVGAGPGTHILVCVCVCVCVCVREREYVVPYACVLGGMCDPAGVCTRVYVLSTQFCVLWEQM